MHPKPNQSQITLTAVLTVICLPFFLLAPMLGLSQTGQIMMAVCGLFIGCAKGLVFSNAKKVIKHPSYIFGRKWSDRVVSSFAFTILITVIGVAEYSHHFHLMPSVVWLWIMLGSALYKAGPEVVIAYHDRHIVNG